MKKLKTPLKILVSVCLLAAMFYIAGPASIWEAIKEADVPLLLYAFIAILLGTIVAAYRWFVVMKILGFRGSLVFYMKSYFKGVFFNQLLPSSIGGDAVRVLNVASLGYEKRYAFVGVLIDRGLGIVGIFIVNIVFNNALPGLLPTEIYRTLNIISSMGIAGFVIFALIYKIKFLNGSKWFKILSVPSKALYDVLNSPLKSLRQLFLTVSVHMLTFAGTYLIAKALGVDIPAEVFMVIMPPVILLTIIPVSMAGWGIREGAMVGFLSFAGVPKNLAVAISVLYGFSYVLQGIVGLYFQFGSKKNGRPAG